MNDARGRDRLLRADDCGRWLRQILLAATLVIVATGPVRAEGEPSRPNGSARPRIGLVLSGGGARGGAHIGVLRVLEELHVPIDCIAGTSAGAIVGAAYASGLPLDALEREMKRLDTATLFRDFSREDIPFRRKLDDATNYIGPELGIVDRDLALPKGAVAGVALEALLRRLTQRQDSVDFDALAIPFRAVASDLATGDLVVLRAGNLARAVRASMAIPGAVNPVEIDDRLLVDGGLVRNLPVDIARDTCADVVIAVNLGTPLLKREQLTSALSVSVQMINILTDANVRASLTQLSPRDVLIAPRFGDLGVADFDRLPEAERAGQEAARSVAEALRRFALSPSEWAALQGVRSGRSRAPGQRVDEIRVVGTERVNPEAVRAAIRTRPGAPADERTLDADMRRVYGRGDFESVNYTLIDESGHGGVLTVDVTEKSWGPNYLRFGLGLSSDFEGNSFFNLLATQRSTWLNAWGGEWRNDLQIGRSDVLRTEWYQPLMPSQRLFVATRAEASRDPFDRYDDGGNRVARFRRIAEEAGVDVGVPLSTIGEARLGLANGRVKIEADTGVDPAQAARLPDVATGGVLARVNIDALDNIRFPRSGYAVSGEAFAARPYLGAADRYTRWQSSLTGALAAGPHSVQLGLRAGGNAGGRRLPPYEQFTLGGFLQLSGYRTGQLTGDQVAFGRLLYNYRLAGPSYFDGAYVGASAEAGRIGRSVLGDNKTGLRHSYSAYVAFDTPLGPVYVAYGVADRGNRTAYFFLGRP